MRVGMLLALNSWLWAPILLNAREVSMRQKQRVVEDSIECV